MKGVEDLLEGLPEQPVTIRFCIGEILEILPIARQLSNELERRWVVWRNVMESSC